jgi:2-phospho-L-lactate transferase CofD-like protein
MRVPASARPGFRRWLKPGMGVKRWLGLIFIGLLLLALGAAHVIRQVTPDLEPGSAAEQIVDLVTLQFLPFALRGLIAGSLGATLVVVGTWRLIRAVTDPLLAAAPGEDQPLVEVIYQKRFLARGPKVVAIGGGTGLSTLLRGMKEHTSNLTAIVTVADDGGSGPSSASRRSATSGTASRPWPTPSPSWPSSSATASREASRPRACRSRWSRAGSAVTPWATSSWRR